MLAERGEWRKERKKSEKSGSRSQKKEISGVKEEREWCEKIESRSQKWGGRREGQAKPKERKKSEKRVVRKRRERR